MKIAGHEKFSLNEGVFVSLSTEGKFSEFEKNYLAAREKEKRVLSIEEIKQLPYVSNNHPDNSLWKIRRKNISRFLKYLTGKKRKLNILDIGCGNGFFTHLMSKQNHQVTGVDVNLLELKQAAKAFDSTNPGWYYADVMKEDVPGDKFDVITFCCSFQYFSDPASLLQRCKSFLAEDGEIHIIDSPFYTAETLSKAKENSLNYYKSIKVESMANFYYHNSYNVLEKYNYHFKYKPNKIWTRLRNDSPFPWILIK